MGGDAGEAYRCTEYLSLVRAYNFVYCEHNFVAQHWCSQAGRKQIKVQAPPETPFQYPKRYINFIDFL